MLCALQGDELQEHRELAQVGEVWEGFPDEVVLEPILVDVIQFLFWEDDCQQQMDRVIFGGEN